MVMVKVNYQKIRWDISDQNMNSIFLSDVYIDNISIYLMLPLEPLELLELSKS